MKKTVSQLNVSLFIGIFAYFSLFTSTSAHRNRGALTELEKRYSAVVDKYLSQMSLREKISQIIISYPPLFGKKEISIGGAILLGGIVKSKERIVRRVNYLQQKARIPLFIAVDMEGGIINPLRRIPALRRVPSHLELSRMGPKKAYKWGYKIGLHLKKMGINCNLAPVLDMAEKGFMYRYKRTFGNDPERVAELAGAFIRGMSQHRIIAIAKHFPGYGDLNNNSDHHIVQISRSDREIQFHLKPFILLKDQFHGVMMANIAIKKFGPEPAIFSPKIIKIAHRYNWLTVTDDLCSNSILRRYGGRLGPAVREAFLAGNDILLMTCLLDMLKKRDDPRFVIAKMIRKQPKLLKSLHRRVKKILLLKLKTFWKPEPLPPKTTKETL